MFGEPLQHLGQHGLGQGGTAGLPLARQVQACQQWQSQDGTVTTGQGIRDGQDNPVVAAGSSDALLGAGDGVTPPTQAPNALAAFVGQSVIYQECDAAEQLQACQEQNTDVVGQSGGCPGRAFKEVVVAIQTVTCGVIGKAAGLSGMGDAIERVFAQTHDPTQQELYGRVKGRSSKSVGQAIDNGAQRIYHAPHGGTSLSLRPYSSSMIGGTPFACTPAGRPSYCSSVQRKMRQSSYKLSECKPFSVVQMAQSRENS